MPEPQGPLPPSPPRGAIAPPATDEPTARRATNSLDWLERLMVLQRAQWLAGQRVLVETYFDQEPLLRLDRGAQLALIEQERSLRQEQGEPVAYEEIVGRFPKLERELRSLFNQKDSAPTLTFGLENRGATLVKPDDTRPDSKFGSKPGGRRSGSALSMRLMEAANAAGYEIVEELGRGGMGVVYKAKHKSLKRLVALKTLQSAIHSDEEQLARFRKEAMAIAKLQHPNIVAVYDVGEFEDSPYLALEFVDGGSLADLLMKGRQSPLQAALLVEPLARAAHAAHQQGIIHRDLKPANILLAKDGTPKISDFGLAKQMDDATGWTKTGDVMGTPCYMAPEQAEGRIKNISALTDVYALGAILYETVTGQPPFRGVTSLETLEMVRTREPAPLRKWIPGVPKDLETIVLKCLEKDQSLRYNSANALADDLQRFIQDEPIHARRSGHINRIARWWRKNQVIGSLFLMVAVLVALLGQQLVSMASKEKLAAGQPSTPVTPSVPLPPAADTGPAPQPSTAFRPTPPPEPTKAAAKPVPTSVAKNDIAKPDLPKRREPTTADEHLAAAQAATDLTTALAHHEEAWKLAKAAATPRQRVDAYKRHLAPALKLADTVGKDGDDPAAMARIARLYSEKGELLRDQPYENWGLKDTIQREAATAFAQALRFHPKGDGVDRDLAEYHTGHGIALTRIEGQKPAAIEKELLADADAAIKADPAYAGGWNLKGFVLYHQAAAQYADLMLESALLEAPARRLPTRQAADAVAAYDQAVAKAKDSSPPDENAAIYLMNRSAAHLLVAYMTDDVEARKKSLVQAAADAEAAIQLSGEYDLAWQALGLAREAQAWKPLRVNDKTQYAAAQAAYRKQIELRGGQGEARLNLGRCQAKELLDDGGAADLAAAAKQELAEAADLDPNLAEAHAWLGRLALHAKDAKAAEAEFLKATQPPAPAAAALRQLKAPLAAQPDLYRKLLDEALKAPADQRSAAHVPLLLQRSLWIAKADPKELRKEQPGPVADAKEAQRLADSAMRKALAHYAAANAAFSIAGAPGILIERRLARLEEFIAEAEAYLKARPDSPVALPIRRQLCNVLEPLSKDFRRTKEERLKFLKQAIEHAEAAGELAVGPDRQSWSRRLQELQKELQKLGAGG